MYDLRSYQAKFKPPVIEYKHPHMNGVLLARAASSPYPSSPTEVKKQLRGCACSLAPPKKHIALARYQLKCTALGPITEGVYHKAVNGYTL